jgi:hypothetical protein
MFLTLLVYYYNYYNFYCDINSNVGSHRKDHNTRTHMDSHCFNPAVYPLQKPEDGLVN